MKNPYDRTDDYAIKGGYEAKSFTFACIREGKTAVLKRTLSANSYREKMKQLFYDNVSIAKLTMNFLWAQACMVAIEAGLNERNADNILRDRFGKIEAADSVDKVIDINEEILCDYAKAVCQIKENNKYSPRVLMCINYIAEHLCDDLSVDTLANELGFSANYLSQFFKKETGQTIMSYILAEKMESAKIMIESSEMSLSQIMACLGYTSQSHFTQTFKKYIGFTPGKYKKYYEAKSHQEANVYRNFYEENESDDTWFTDALDYAMAAGFKEQDYLLFCIRRGKVSALKEQFEDINVTARWQLFFGGSLIHATESMLSLWPQAIRAAIESGLDSEKAAQLLKQSISRLYGCLNTEEIMELNGQFLIELAKEVSEV